MKLRPVLAAVVLLCASPGALALDSVSAEIGRGSGQSTVTRVGLQWNGHREAFEHSRWQIAHYIDLSFGGWNGQHGTVYDLGFTPVFRFQRSPRSVFFEAAIGFHMISDLEFRGDIETSTRFQFGDHLGVGWRVDGRNELMLRLQHLSNAGIRNPNPGINFLQLRWQHALR